MFLGYFSALIQSTLMRLETFLPIVSIAKYHLYPPLKRGGFMLQNNK